MSENLNLLAYQNLKGQLTVWPPSNLKGKQKKQKQKTPRKQNKQTKSPQKTLPTQLIGWPRTFNDKKWRPTS